MLNDAKTMLSWTAAGGESDGEVRTHWVLLLHHRPGLGEARQNDQEGDNDWQSTYTVMIVEPAEYLFSLSLNQG
jgi:hypothetical protein